MQIAIIGAGFSPARADELRRAMATFRNDGTISPFRGEFVGGMVKKGYALEFAERCFRQIEGFGSYGFPESHAASFAQLDYTSTGLSLRHHPLGLLRPRLVAERLADTRTLNAAKRGTWLRLPGLVLVLVLVLVRQRPGSAKGVVFFTVEDGWGVANLVLYPDLAQRFRAAVVSARLVVAEGRVERHEAAVPIIHLIVRRLIDRSELLAGLSALEAPEAAPWRHALARADEVTKPDLRGAPRVKLPPSRDFH